MREPLTKKVRFEVFKRDLFTCQYCGRKSPEIVLNVDHIKPVAEGGTNAILNLVTACFDCNAGKSDRSLSDQSAVIVARRQAEESELRVQQIKMIAEWQQSINDVSPELEEFGLVVRKTMRRDLTESGRQTVKKVLKEYGFKNAIEAFHIAVDRYPALEVIGKLGGICFNRHLEKTDPKAHRVRQFMFKISYGWRPDRVRYEECKPILGWLLMGHSDEYLKRWVKESRIFSWHALLRAINELKSELENHEDTTV